MLLSQYSHKIIEIKERPLKPLLLFTSIYWTWMKKQISVILDLDNIRKKKQENFQLNFTSFNLNLEIWLNLINLIWKNKNGLQRKYENCPIYMI